MYDSITKTLTKKRINSSIVLFNNLYNSLIRFENTPWIGNVKGLLDRTFSSQCNCFFGSGQS